MRRERRRDPRLAGASPGQDQASSKARPTPDPAPGARRCERAQILRQFRHPALERGCERQPRPQLRLEVTAGDRVAYGVQRSMRPLRREALRQRRRGSFACSSPSTTRSRTMAFWIATTCRSRLSVSLGSLRYCPVRLASGHHHRLASMVSFCAAVTFFGPPSWSRRRSPGARPASRPSLSIANTCP